jgi:hypothetical protein
MALRFKNEKLCKGCNLIKVRAEYYIKKEGWISFYCKECSKEFRKNRALKYPEKIKAQTIKYKDKARERQIKFRLENPELMKERRKKYRDNLGDYYKEYRKLNKESINNKLKIYQKERRKSDILYKTKQYMSNRIRVAFNSTGKRKCSKTEELLGCSISELKLYIESKMDIGMSWDNYGYYGWHIDHIKPLSSAKTESELISLCHYKNLQPLYRLDNQKKGSLGFRNPFKTQKTA